MRGEFSDQEQQELRELAGWGNANLLNIYWDETGGESSTINTDPVGSNSTFFQCQAKKKNCLGQIVIFHYSRPNYNPQKEVFKKIDYSKIWPEEKKYEVQQDCYLKGDNDFTCANCHEGKKSNNVDKIKKLKEEISQLEKITNRTPEQERELKDKKKELAELEKQQEQNSNKTDWIPWIIGGGIILVLVIVVIYLLTRNNRE